MTTLNVALTLASPLLTGEPHQGNTYESYNHLPGSVLRGAVAAALMAGWSHAAKQIPHPEQCPDPVTCDFCRVLYPRQEDGRPGRPPRFYDCYPAMSGSSPVQPLPLTARTCKLYPGFLRPDETEEKHGIFDTLIAQAAASQARQQAPTHSYVYTLTCPHCGEALVSPESDYYGRYGDTFYTATPLNRRFSRTAINRRRHTAQSGQLFTLTVMGEQMRTGLPEPAPGKTVTRLEGQVEAGDADLTALQDALRQVKWLGSSSSRGLGQIDTLQVRAVPPAPASKIDNTRFRNQVASGQYQTDTDGPADLGNRLAAFNKAVQAERAFYRAIGIPDILPGWYFSLDLLSDTFVRQQGLPGFSLTAEQLQLPGAKAIFRATVPIERGGWSNAWGLPRYREQGLGRGSVFLFRVDGAEPATVASLMTRLAQLEENGLGTDLARGAGRLQVCAPFHQEVKPR